MWHFIEFLAILCMFKLRKSQPKQDLNDKTTVEEGIPLTSQTQPGGTTPESLDGQVCTNNT